MTEFAQVSAEGRILNLLREAKKIAREYRELTGKPLGITGEVAEYEAACALGYQLTPARHAGYDAIRSSDGRRFQIKGRCILPGSGRSQRIGRIDIRKEFDAVLLVLLNENFDALEIHEAERDAVIKVLTAVGSRARNERGALGVSKFRSIGRQVWQRPVEAGSV